MGMDVDEAGGNDLSTDVQNMSCLTVEVRSNFLNQAVLDTQVGSIGLRPTPINDRSIFQNIIKKNFSILSLFFISENKKVL